MMTTLKKINHDDKLKSTFNENSKNQPWWQLLKKSTMMTTFKKSTMMTTFKKNQPWWQLFEQVMLLSQETRFGSKTLIDNWSPLFSFSLIRRTRGTGWRQKRPSFSQRFRINHDDNLTKSLIQNEYFDTLRLNSPLKHRENGFPKMYSEDPSDSELRSSIVTRLTWKA